MNWFTQLLTGLWVWRSAARGRVIPVATAERGTGEVAVKAKHDYVFSRRELSMIEKMREYEARLPWCDDTCPLIERIEMLLTDKGSLPADMIAIMLRSDEDTIFGILTDNSTSLSSVEVDHGWPRLSRNLFEPFDAEGIDSSLWRIAHA